MNIKKIILTGLVIWLVGTVFAFLTCGWLFNWVYRIPPIIWHAPETMMSSNNMVWSNILGIIIGIVFVLVYATLYKGIPGKGVKKGINYGLLVWLVGSVSGVITLPFYMTIAWTVVIYWIFQALVLSVIKGAIVGAMYKENKKIL